MDQNYRVTRMDNVVRRDAKLKTLYLADAGDEGDETLIGRKSFTFYSFQTTATVLNCICSFSCRSHLSLSVNFGLWCINTMNLQYMQVELK